MINDYCAVRAKVSSYSVVYYENRHCNENRYTIQVCCVLQYGDFCMFLVRK